MKSKFHEWFRDAFEIWSGGKKSISQFAVYLGISQATASALMNGTRGIPTSKKIIDAIGQKFPEVYDVLGLPLPGFTLEDSNEFFTGIKKAAILAKKRNIDPESPEFDHIIKEVFAKYGDKVEKEID